MGGINKLFFALLSLTAFVFGYPFSFLPSKIDNSFEIKDCNSCFAEKADEKTVVFGINSRASCFNYFGVRYSCDSFVRGSFVYSNGFRKSNEDFFLEPGENKEFYSFIDGVLSKKKANTIVSLSFSALDKDCIDFTLNGFSVFNRKVPDKTVYLETDKVKIGVSMKWGGALSYLEDLDSSVELVSKDGEIHADTNASKRYSSLSLNKHVNLI
nr:hypothetical protein [Clostridiales bacterium]